MKITFRIEYRTAWGEEIGVNINGNETKLIPLSTRDGIIWEGKTEYEVEEKDKILSYRYGVYRNHRCIRLERGNMQHIIPTIVSKKDICIQVDDNWRDLPINSFLYSSAFSRHYLLPIEHSFNYSTAGNIIFRALCPTLRHRNQKLGISGNGEVFGNWNPEKPIEMFEIKQNEWIAVIDASQLNYPLEYKFVAIDEKTNKVVEWENHNNRIINQCDVHPTRIYTTPEAEVFFNAKLPKVAGTTIPIFSLKSEGSFGVGDFGDLKKMIDWAVLTHQHAIQILPINDTTITNTWTDSYPYNSISIYAFHPMYIDLRQVEKLKDEKLQSEYDTKQQELNALPQVDYEAVNEAKRSYLKLLFKQEGKRKLSTNSFKEFYQKNAHWLQPYAAFSFLRDKYGTPKFSEWPEYTIYKKEDIDNLCDTKSKSYNEISFYYYVQYLLHIQLLNASDYAREKGVILKGDIPIGISRNSVEAWIEPYYFNMNGQAGAPPDAFSANGQNWGFPTYNWDVMEKDNYQWWQKRFRKMAEYFTAYRIDHILGFFRIWEIPTHSVHGLLGQFVPSLPMSTSEIESYGLPFQKEFMTKPFINDKIIKEKFGEKSEYVVRHFLRHEHHDIYSMQPKFDTQRKVEAYFANKSDEESLTIKEGLYSLISDVLFVPDRKDKNLYHPRIAVQNDYVYKQLSWKEKEAFNNLYNDYYYKRHNRFWYEQAMKKLPTLTQSTSMLCCGEDLGMVPDCVPWVMNELEILSLEIQRMPKNPAHEFGHVWEYPYRSVCTISTHDMSTLRGWWEENYNQTSHFYKHIMGHWDETPKIASGWVCEEIIKRHLECPSILCILSFQDWLSMDEDIRNKNVEAERINIPAIPRYYWRYRMHLSIEELIKCDKINEKIRNIIDENERN
ncbi:4-alpha-glucanotransferase [Phocaeicola oris]|uniref:4-alpha-glucanotransferase n=1 Tax=Phocaeicola oris TaxID=2896850 RepID=UPI00234F5038|nr:4-alpha-glucanotransferase [Phocaeicola oris]MCE2617287.1 4-alpha-glucanotransferase [Phocaeicola oris]